MILMASATLGAPSFEPVFNPTLETIKIAKAIKVDGKLDDAGWSLAGVAANFVERNPGDNTRPLVDTRAYITYDDDNLYVAFVCKDDPDAIRATMCQRDQYDGDDAVGVLVDTYGEASWAYEFFVNPYGIQKDRLWTTIRGEDPGFDMIWHAAAKVTDSGYQVEMAIPFAGMRFPNTDIQNWKVDFWRIHPRESYRQYSWSANNRDEQCWPCQWGTVSGIGGIEAGKGLEILPSMVASQSGGLPDDDPDNTFENGDILGSVAVGAKYSVTSDITLEATANPDFSQIEADAAQIDVNSTIALFFPERRPFFQEGSDLFITMFNSFYTRMVNDPEVAAKGTARWENSSLAYMFARDENSPYIIPTENGSGNARPGKSTVNVLRGLRTLGNNSQLGFMVSDRRYDIGGSNTILSGDGTVRLSRTYSAVGQFVFSHTEEPNDLEVNRVNPDGTFDDGNHTFGLDGESYSGTAFVSELRRRSRNWNFTIDYNQLTPTYQTQTGYDPWNDQKNLFAWTRYNFRPASGPFERITPNVYFDRRWNWDNVRKWAHFNAGVDAQLRWAQTYVGLSYGTSSEVWGGQVYDDLWSANINLNGQPMDKLGYQLSYNFGEGAAVQARAKGKETNLNVGMDIKPIDRLMVEPSLAYASSKHVDSNEKLYEELIFRTRFRLQVNPRLSVRLVVQYDDYSVLYDDPEGPDYYRFAGRAWDIDPLVTYRINSFSVFYFGSTHDISDFGVPTGGLNTVLPNEAPSKWLQNNRQFFMKLQYLFQI
jgi:hypothetical protein